MTSSVKVIGTSHIAASSAREIERAFDELQPDIIAVELDRRRLQSLLERSKGTQTRIPASMIRQVGVTGYLFLLIGGWLQKKLAGIVKVQPGVDMLAAVKLAREHKKPLMLVDQDVMITMRKLSKAFSAKEKLRLVWDLFTSPFHKQKIKIRLDQVPSAATIKKLMILMKKQYPSFYRVLVEERNAVMAAKLRRILADKEHTVLFVVGAGHEEDLKKRLAKDFNLL